MKRPGKVCPKKKRVSVEDQKNCVVKGKPHEESTGKQMQDMDIADEKHGTGFQLLDAPLRCMLFHLARQGEGRSLARCMCVCKAWKEATKEVL